MESSLYTVLKLKTNGMKKINHGKVRVIGMLIKINARPIRVNTSRINTLYSPSSVSRPIRVFE